MGTLSPARAPSEVQSPSFSPKEDLAPTRSDSVSNNTVTRNCVSHQGWGTCIFAPNCSLLRHSRRWGPEGGKHPPHPRPTGFQLGSFPRLEPRVSGPDPLSTTTRLFQGHSPPPREWTQDPHRTPPSQSLESPSGPCPALALRGTHRQGEGVLGVPETALLPGDLGSPGPRAGTPLGMSG